VLLPGLGVLVLGAVVLGAVELELVDAADAPAIPTAVPPVASAPVTIIALTVVDMRNRRDLLFVGSTAGLDHARLGYTPRMLSLRVE
jgi:hypothetical protein